MSIPLSESQIMEYARGHPCLYGLHGEMAIQTERGWVEVVKNGSTWHIGNRKSGAITYFPVKPQFLFVIVLDKNAFISPAELYTLDAQFVEFLKEKSLGSYYIEKEGGKEWFYRDCPIPYLTLRLEFLQQKHFLPFPF
jgi:hypothetical protein